MTGQIQIESKENHISNIELTDNSDLMYFLSLLKSGSLVRIAVNDPDLFCKIEIFETEEEVFS